MLHEFFCEWKFKGDGGGISVGKVAAHTIQICSTMY